MSSPVESNGNDLRTGAVLILNLWKNRSGTLELCGDRIRFEERGGRVWFDVPFSEVSDVYFPSFFTLHFGLGQLQFTIGGERHRFTFLNAASTTPIAGNSDATPIAVASSSIGSMGAIVVGDRWKNALVARMPEQVAKKYVPKRGTLIGEFSAMPPEARIAVGGLTIMFGSFCLLYVLIDMF